MAPILPQRLSRVEYRALRAEPARWLPAVRELALRHGFGDAEAVPIAAGSNLVAALGAHAVIKLFPPALAGQAVSERRALPALAGKLSIATPQLLATGELGSWHYVIASRVGGEPLAAIWASASAEVRARLVAQIGRVIAEVHALPVGELADLPPAWPGFLAAQRASCVARHTAAGVPAHLIAGLDAYVAAGMPELPDRFAPVILTGEYTPENLLVTADDRGGFTLTGMVDFGDAMIGYRDYDLLGPLAFLCAGDPALVHALIGEAPRPAAWMTLLLLHRYSNLDVQLATVTWRTAPDWDALARRVFAATVQTR